MKANAEEELAERARTAMDFFICYFLLVLRASLGHEGFKGCY
jgi:hypothetical protein